MLSLKKLSLLLIIAGSCPLFAETHITGDITGMTFESGGNPYIVEQDVLLPAGNRAVIKEGCVFLFKPFTGLTVHGHLVVDGTQEAPVIFTSVNDGEFNTASEQLPNPFDWNGILVTRESGTVSLKYFALRYSVYGIKSQNSNIQIENGQFRQNGQFHFTINDKIQFVQDNIAYSYSGTPETTKDKPKNPDQPEKLPVHFAWGGHCRRRHRCCVRNNRGNSLYGLESQKQGGGKTTSGRVRQRYDNLPE